MKTYDCYSHKLMKHLLTVGIVPYKIDKHYKTKRTFWRYDLTDELSKALYEWSSNKNKN